MRVLVLGANGFIGSAVVAALHGAGMETRCLVRDAARFRRRFPGAEVHACDFGSESVRNPQRWLPWLEGVDAVVNVAGVLQPRSRSVAWAVHRDAPRALFRACETAGVRRVVQVSAIGVEEAETTFARSKRAGDEALTASDLDWTVLRPALVIGDGSYGGTSLLRALSVFPGVLPVVGDGSTPVDVLHKDDLAAGIVALLRSEAAIRAVLEPAGPSRLPAAGILSAYRAWFGLRRAPLVRVPDWLGTLLARIGDVTQTPPMNSTMLAQFRRRATGDAAAFERATGVRSRSLEEILASRPCESQDLWHARLFLLRPLVRLCLAILWGASGVVGLLADPARYAPLLQPLTTGQAHALGLTASAADLAIALALVFGWRLRMMAWVQIAAVCGYTVGLGLLAPQLWADPFGGLLKNVPILVLLLAHRILEEER